MKNNNDMTEIYEPSIIDAIHIASIGWLVPLTDKYPELKNILLKSNHPTDDWDFFVTAAGTGIVLSTSESFEGEHNLAKQRAIKINKDILRASEDFISFMNKGENSAELLAPTIGMWILWNLKQEQPIYDEMKELSPVIGNLLLKIITDWRNS